MGRSQTQEDGGGRSQSPGNEPGEGTAMESKAVLGKSGRYLDFGGSVGAESDQGAETEPGILNTQLEPWRRTRGLGEVEPRREARPGGGLGCSLAASRVGPGQAELRMELGRTPEPAKYFTSVTQRIHCD